ncbi:pimeloyl-ACP methyl ester carboxylesterase [Rhodoligotrophos appendicifer]|uniref:alpha/beta fold hydrolase n=1 Tax=Rhodoligotrophos appendicifer TaxID=987056 RepID=UPI001478E4F1|nr:alpha/beta hydrolase [Rhodoligotrophos appendicifer]
MPRTKGGLHFSVSDCRAPWARDTLPVLFNHGIGTNMDIWAEWVPIVAARHRVVRFDMRGFGQSAVPAEDHVWSMDEMVADLWEVADGAGVERVHLMGESMGGTIVLAAAVARPERVASVSISNASFKGKGLGELAYWRTQFAEGGAEGWSRRMMENRFADGAGEARALTWFQEEQARTRPHVAMGLGGVLAQSDLTEALKSLEMPVSVTLPDSSPFVPVAHGVELKELAKNTRLRVVPGVRHGLPFSHGVEEARHLLAFLDSLDES